MFFLLWGDGFMAVVWRFYVKNNQQKEQTIYYLLYFVGDCRFDVVRK